MSPWGVQSESLGVLGGPWGVPGGSLGDPWRVPGGSWEAPGGLPEDFRDSGRPPERSKGAPEEHFGVILEQFGGHLGVIFESKYDSKCM